MPTVEKYIARELILRVSAIVLALSSLIVASTCIAAIDSKDIIQSNEIIRLNDEYYGVNLRATSGWLIFLSLIVTAFHTVAIIELFMDIKFLRIKIPLGKSLWYLFTIIKLVVSVVSIIGYLGVLVPMTVFISYLIAEIVEIIGKYDNISVTTSSGGRQLITSIVFIILFTLGAVVRSIAMVIFILLAKFKYRCGKYDPTDSTYVQS